MLACGCGRANARASLGSGDESDSDESDSDGEMRARTSSSKTPSKVGATRPAWLSPAPRSAAASACLRERVCFVVGSGSLAMLCMVCSDPNGSYKRIGSRGLKLVGACQQRADKCWREKVRHDHVAVTLQGADVVFMQRNVRGVSAGGFDYRVFHSTQICSRFAQSCDSLKGG